ncbi:CLC-type chloride channel, putative [Leishmania panamensis]|uniref:CLC-type chloride channel, putative n=3 Tax=Leishmania guyanensis species complex TaxID=38579 RepID=A0A088RIZ3_LEIPA|nr:CLC-type chloride channel, putative [Leishmania panamensis]AIN95119.1 CLC-type chloride channel, putative [Leishmania panamensis]CCM12488.1 CLC-type chloride channel, putative [Leishmania guyanensis]CCM35849.1 CLC-type chloride channel, putative [Leishmania guyanensis]
MTQAGGGCGGTGVGGDDEAITRLVVNVPEADWATIDCFSSYTEAAERAAMRRRHTIPSTTHSPYGEKRPAYSFQGEAFLAALACGIALGCLGVISDACARWVSAFRSGICANFFWLDRSLCCVDGNECDEYYSWGEFFLGRDNHVVAFVDFVMYVGFSTLAAVTAAYLCKTYAPYASGGGIAEVKTIVSGYHVKRYLGGWTLITKVVAMCFSTGSGLTVGKEGPFVHIGACVGGIISGAFPSYQQETKERELITAGAGGGMAVAFGAPVGGVIFALEDVSTSYNFKALMAALICGVTAVLLQSRVDLWHTGCIVQFSINYRHNWHFFELPMFAVIGCFGGFMGSTFSVINLHICRWRKKHVKQWRLAEVTVVAAITGVVNFLTPYSSGGMLELLGDCFQDCTPDSSIEMCEGSDVRAFFSLLVTATAKFAMFTYTVGTFLPAGILVPSLTIGALYGRAFGMMFRSLQETYAGSYIFTECYHQDLCVIPGVYAIVGAAAMLTGVTHMTICLAIIMFELTGSLEYMVPIIVGILCAKAAGEAVGVKGTYEIVIEENKLPYLDPKKEFYLDFSAKDVYKNKQFTVLTAYGLQVRDINELVTRMNVTGFPVVESASDTTLLGYAPTKKMMRAIQVAAVRNRDVSLSTYTRFKTAPSHSQDPNFLEVNLTNVLESCLLQVEPECSVKKLLYLFKSLGTHHIVVCRYAKFEGFISKKDFINFMRVKEREENMEDDELERERRELARQRRRREVATAVIDRTTTTSAVRATAHHR